MEVVQWQAQLRRQFGREQTFELENLGEEPVFSEFQVTNSKSGGRYRVAIRGTQPGDNFCACPDFATNDLGTCKHIEFVLAKLERRRGGRQALKRGFRPSYSEIYLQYGGERRVRFRAGTQCPPMLAKRALEMFSGPPGDVLPLERFDELATLLTAAQRADHELHCYEDVLGFIAQARDAAERNRILDAAYPQGAASPALATLVKARLYPYQAEGALFAARAGRCLIGDEMGLGKTVQAIAALELFVRHFGAERALIVCPTSLKYQWQRELARFGGREAQVIGGVQAARLEQYGASGTCKVVNYDVLDQDLEAIQRFAPDVVIVDEAQRIKNWNTVAARALKRIESPYALVLTGTPLENRLEELVSIVQYVDRYRLGPTWKLRFTHQTTDEHGRVIGYRDLDQLGRTLAPVLLRRRKAEVLAQLPPRMDNTLFVPMSAEQRRYHEENAEIVARIVRRWQRTGYLSDADQRRLTCALQNMRMSCNSSYLLDQQTDDGAKPDELVTLLEECFERPDAKAVVFSQWRRTHELIVRRLERRKWGYVLFHGGVPAHHRGALVERFHQDPHCRVFLSTDAGGVGLNLQHAAATVINMDLPWNPAVLEQRIGRVHRLGQQHGVQVVNFVAEDSIEARMLTLLAFKRSLFAGVLDGGDREVFLGGSRLQQFMKSVSAVTEAAEPDELRATAHRAQAADSAEVSSAAPVAALSPVVGPSLDANAGALATGDEHSNVGSNTQPATQANPWAPLLSAGLELMKSLSAAMNSNNDAGNGAQSSPAARAWIEKDATTGRSYLKLPVPEPQVVQQLSEALTRLFAGFGR
jgi:superfamily II DNA or RNA helicase